MANSVDIELVVNGPKQSRILPVVSHVNKYMETIIYSKWIQEAACPLDYFENETINAEKNMFIFDKSFLADNNKQLLSAFVNKFNQVDTNVVLTPYKSILVTNVLAVSKEGTEIPLFYKHELPIGAKEVDIEISTNMNSEIYGSYKIDIENLSIYTNYQNHFNFETGEYRIFFLHIVDKNGNSIRELLNPVKSVKELSWEDIDLETGLPKKGLLSFTTEQNVSGYTFRMNGDGPWYWKPTDTSTINIIKPAGISRKDNWNIRIKNGELKTYSNGKYVKYWIPEFAQQPFNPFIPYSFALNKSMYYVNERTLSFTHGDVAVYPKRVMHLEIFCYDENDSLVEIFTTDESKKGSFYRDTNVIYKTEVIDSWDNKSGIVALNENIESRYSYYANHFFQLKSYEMKEISFNPLQNKEVKDYTWVIYCIPDLSYDEKSIHYLGVDKAGVIRYVSQGESRGYPNFKMKNIDGSFNKFTMLGKQYKTSSSTDKSFVNLYSNLTENDYQYLILGEVYIMEKEIREDSFFVDVREKTRFLKKDNLSDIFKRNPRIVQSIYGYGEEGQEYAKNNALIYELPITLLNEYGGQLNEKQIEKILRKVAPISKKIIVKYIHKSPGIKIDNTEIGKIKISLSWEGPGLTYRIYRKERPQQKFTMVKEIVNPTEAFEYIDMDLERKKYFYQFSIVENGIEYPPTNLFTVQGV